MANPHPLDPLTAQELRTVQAVLQAGGAVNEAFRFCAVELVEPPKELVLSWRTGQPHPRRALVVLWDRSTSRTFEAVVDLAAEAVESFRHVPGAMANLTVDEWRECDEALRRDPVAVHTLAERGMTDLDLVLFDVWAYRHADRAAIPADPSPARGPHTLPDHLRGRRLGLVDVWQRSQPGGNPYAHLVAGLKLVVDLNTFEILEVEDAGEVAAAPVRAEYEPEFDPLISVREDRKPLEIVQPEGPGFTVDGNELRWHEWSLRVGFNHREGLVLHQLAYAGRSVAYRLSFAEMIVPYRDPSRDHRRRAAYDIGEWGLGAMTTSLERGCDCLGEIRYVDAVLADSRGTPQPIPNAICLHEEDNGVLWKHVDEQRGAQTRRMRRFVISCHATVANYDYLIYWRLYEDGSIECEVRATGIMVTTPLRSGQKGHPFGTVIDERTYAPNHQHFIVARLDLDVDGTANTVLEVDAVALPTDPSNPDGLALTTTATPIRSEVEAGRQFDWAAQRSWKVVNPARLNRMGLPVGYQLVPGACLPPLMAADAPQMRRAPVLGKQLWVTRRHDEERWPAGAYPTQNEQDMGMSRWIADDEPLEDSDVVLWYVFGLLHIPRPEDWPVMPVDTASFWLKPFGFFDRNPALDVAPADHCAPTAGGGHEAHAAHAGHEAHTGHGGAEGHAAHGAHAPHEAHPTHEANAHQANAHQANAHAANAHAANAHAANAHAANAHEGHGAQPSG